MAVLSDCLLELIAATVREGAAISERNLPDVDLQLKSNDATMTTMRLDQPPQADLCGSAGLVAAVRVTVAQPTRYSLDDGDCGTERQHNDDVGFLRPV